MCWLFVTATTMVGSPTFEMNTYLRIASISVALYEWALIRLIVSKARADAAMIDYSYILTLPAEWRFYSSQSSIMSMRYVENYKIDIMAHRFPVSLVSSSFWFDIRASSIIFISMYSTLHS